MLRARWYKVINDLFGNKTRTLLIMLSLAVGLFAHRDNSQRPLHLI